jgi:hypothetical protein
MTHSDAHLAGQVRQVEVDSQQQLAGAQGAPLAEVEHLLCGVAALDLALQPTWHGGEGDRSTATHYPVTHKLSSYQRMRCTAHAPQRKRAFAGMQSAFQCVADHVLHALFDVCVRGELSDTLVSDVSCNTLGQPQVQH